jgi:hypothetical protein
MELLEFELDSNMVGEGCEFVKKADFERLQEELNEVKGTLDKLVPTVNRLIQHVKQGVPGPSTNPGVQTGSVAQTASALVGLSREKDPRLFFALTRAKEFKDVDLYNLTVNLCEELGLKFSSTLKKQNADIVTDLYTLVAPVGHDDGFAFWEGRIKSVFKNKRNEYFNYGE